MIGRLLVRRPATKNLLIGSNYQTTKLCTGPSETQELSHVKSDGSLQMVDVGLKQETRRVAVASCCVKLCQQAFKAVQTNTVKKGDVLTTAKLAGMMGAKRTSDLIPLCHPIPISNVDVDIQLREKDISVYIRAEVGCTGRTGVEMEALTATTISALTVYDMCKGISQEISITDVQLDEKYGGKRDYKRT